MDNVFKSNIMLGIAEWNTENNFEKMEGISERLELNELSDMKSKGKVISEKDNVGIVVDEFLGPEEEEEEEEDYLEEFEEEEEEDEEDYSEEFEKEFEEEEEEEEEDYSEEFEKEFEEEEEEDEEEGIIY